MGLRRNMKKFCGQCLLLAPTRSRRSGSSLASHFYNEEQKALQKETRKIIEGKINPLVEQWEKQHSFPAHQVFKTLGQAGLLGINKPKDVGGLALNHKYQMAFLEACGNITSPGVAMAIGVQTDCATPALARFGSRQLKDLFLAPAVAGDQVSCIGISEAGAGSDVAGLKTTAVRRGGDLIINGHKMWITNSMQADWMALLANTNHKASAHLNKSLIIMPMDLPGVIRAKKIQKMGMNSSDTGLIHLDNVRVPASYIVGEEGQGFVYQMMQFTEERLAAGAGCLAPLCQVIQQTIDYTSQRQIFGRSLLHHQTVHFRLAELKTEVELLRALLYQTAEAMLQGHDVTLMAAMIKLKCGRLARQVTDSCLQFWGGMGFTDDAFVSRMYRDLRLWSIGGGADEVMLTIISKHMAKTGR